MLTRHRFNLTEIENYNHLSANKTLEQLKEWQIKIENQYGEELSLYALMNFIFWLMKVFLRLEILYDFPQLENGIGLPGFSGRSFPAFPCRKESGQRL